MSKRKYNSKSLYFTDRKAYYEQQKGGKAIASIQPQSSSGVDFFSSNPEKMIGYVGGPWSERGILSRDLDFAGVNSNLNKRFPNLTGNGALYRNQGGYISISEIVWLCQKAWEEFQLFRNTIEAMVEFSLSEIKLSSKNKSAKNFCEAWLKAINIDAFAEQWYRELYRSCNVFVYPMKGEIDSKDVKSLKALAAGRKEIPVKYTVLNPAQVALLGGITSTSEVYKVLSPYEIKRLQKPHTQAEKLLYEKLDPEVKKAIKSYAGVTTTAQIYIKLDDVSATFYQKQDYEYFGVPLFYGVLEDIELKLEMKKTDKKLLSTFENMILKITLGGYKGPDGEELPPNPEHMTYLRGLFQNQQAQRVLVADYTTEVEYIIPDIEKIVGKAKYEQVNEDIREGLQSIFGSNEKFSNQMTKVKVFVERLQKGQKMFKSWLEGELSNVCKTMGFSETPKVKMSKITLEDPTQTNRVFVRMAELGFLTPDGLNTAIESGMLPEPEEAIDAQKKFLEEKDDRLWGPQMFNNPQQVEMAEKQIKSSEKQAKEQNKVKVQQTKNPPKSNGRPAGATQPQSGDRKSRVVGNVSGISLSTIQDCLGQMEVIKAEIGQEIKDKYNISELSEAQNKFTESIAKQVVKNYDKDVWTQAIKDVIESQEVKNNYEMQEQIEDICASFDLEDDFLGALIYHSKTSAPSQN